jgi:hypothetical protein
VWSFDINPDETRLVTGSNDGDLRIWALHLPTDTTATTTASSSASSSSSAAAAAAASDSNPAARKARKLHAAADAAASAHGPAAHAPPEWLTVASGSDVATLYGIIKRTAGTHRVSSIRFVVVFSFLLSSLHTSFYL